MTSFDKVETKHTCSTVNDSNLCNAGQSGNSGSRPISRQWAGAALFTQTDAMQSCLYHCVSLSDFSVSLFVYVAVDLFVCLLICLSVYFSQCARLSGADCRLRTCLHCGSCFQAHGLSFSVPRGIKPPPSLKNIYKELEKDINGFVAPDHGCLEKWAQKGVLLLNATLTVE